MRLYQKALLVAAGIVVFQSGAMETGHTLPLNRPLPRTNVAPAYSQTCDTATVTLMSDWNGVTHATINGPSPSIAVDVPPNGYREVTFKIVPSPLKVTITSSNGHITGANTHTFTVSPCPTTPTTVPVATTVASCPPGAHPDGPVSPCAWDVPTTVPAFVPPVVLDNPSLELPVPTTVETPTTTAPAGGVAPPAPGPSTPRPLQPGDRLAETGSSTVDGLRIAGIFLVAGAVVVVATRRKRVS